jgi:MFS transporter, Spinster family, sphingosine-1-phosphate transporter
MAVARAGTIHVRAWQLAPLPLLTLVNFFNYLDRQIVYGMLGLIGDDLTLSKVQLGCLGTANLLVFALVSLLSGPLADRFGRRLVLSGAIGLWSLATIGSAAAPSYVTLLVCRALVGVGEGVYGPGCNALLCAASPPERRGWALGIFNVGMALGGTVGLALGAGLAPMIGWRAALLVAGLPGFVLAAASLLVVLPSTTPEAAPALSPRTVLTRPTFLIALAGGALGTFGMSGLIAWSEVLLSVERAVPSVSAGVFMLTAGIACGAGGAVLGGWIGDTAKRRHAGGYSLAIGLSFVGGGLVGLLALHTYAIAPFLGLVALAILLLSIYNGPAAAVVHEMVPPRLAATAQGVFLFGIHLLGNAPAPAIVGWIAEHSTVTAALHVPVAAFVVSGMLFVAVARIQKCSTVIVGRHHAMIGSHATLTAKDGLP